MQENNILAQKEIETSIEDGREVAWISLRGRVDDTIRRLLPADGDLILPTATVRLSKNFRFRRFVYIHVTGHEDFRKFEVSRSKRPGFVLLRGVEGISNRFDGKPEMELPLDSNFDHLELPSILNQLVDRIIDVEEIQVDIFGSTERKAPSDHRLIAITLRHESTRGVDRQKSILRIGLVADGEIASIRMSEILRCGVLGTQSTIDVIATTSGDDIVDDEGSLGRLNDLLGTLIASEN